MLETYVGRAPAKLNLILEVTAKRPDGYHEVDTILQELELADEVRLTLGLGHGVRVQGPFARGVPRGKSNLALQAASLLAVRLGRPEAAVTIDLVKNIPAAGGLGGGAADAVTVLRLLQGPWSASEGDVLAIANQLGSDEAFLLQGGTARARGRGEQVERLPPLDRHGVVLFVPPATIEQKTARMFAALGRMPFDPGGVADAFVTLETRSFTSCDAYNAFERVAFDLFAGLHSLCSDLESRVGDAVRLCGAGPTLFWIGRSAAAARVAKAAAGADCTVILTATASAH
ncbi:MAG: 4-(cytidine 5'-diphospho)-2-C-methyl-D-erythritol kinase [Tepidiformaceae bacterium]